MLWRLAPRVAQSPSQLTYTMDVTVTMTDTAEASESAHSLLLGSAATAEQLEKLGMADRDTMGAVPQHGGVQEGDKWKRGDVLDWNNAQHSGVGALIKYMPLQRWYTLTGVLTVSCRPRSAVKTLLVSACSVWGPISANVQTVQRLANALNALVAQLANLGSYG